MSLPDLDWQTNATCNTEKAPVDLFFLDPGDAHLVWIARRYCQRCPVTQECLNYADQFSLQDGIFGGLTPKQRRNRRKENRKAKP